MCCGSRTCTGCHRGTAVRRKEACDPHARSQWKSDVSREPKRHQTWPRYSILEAHLLLKGIQRSHRHVLCDLRDLLLAQLFLLRTTKKNMQDVTRHAWAMGRTSATNIAACVSTRMPCVQGHVREKLPTRTTAAQLLHHACFLIPSRLHDPAHVVQLGVLAHKERQCPETSKH